MIGALVGGGVTFAANWLTARAQRLQTAVTRGQALNDRMIAAHVEYLMRVDVFYDRATALRTALCEGNEDQKPILRSACEEAWMCFIKAKGPATIAGPAELVKRMDSLDAAILQYAEHIDTWWAGHRPQPKAQCNLEAKQYSDDLRKRREQYVMEAQRQFYGGIAPTSGA
ncbi:hypothetical protein [Nocardia sp. NPDC005825]|uniref:hypothetical protein n=1 Tax=unclassified Nocardia TaxID=2637762 RepID=UPI0033CE339B